MKFLSRLVAVFLLLLFSAPMVGFEGKLAKVSGIDILTEGMGHVPSSYFDDTLITEIKQHTTSADTPSQATSMKSICVRVSLKKGATEAVKEWFRTLMDRREETLASLKNEGVVVESAFLDQQPDGDFLIYYMRAEDIEKAIAVFQNSSLAIDAYHKDCWGKYCEASSALEQLLDLDTFQMEN